MGTLIISKTSIIISKWWLLIIWLRLLPLLLFRIVRAGSYSLQQSKHWKWTWWFYGMFFVVISIVISTKN
jgi:hypothetical protein